MDILKLLKNQEGVYVYEASAACVDGVECAIIRKNGKKLLAAKGGDFEGEVACDGIRLCELSEANARELMRRFPYTAPVSHKGRAFSIGLGDRLGRATPGQLMAVKKYNVFPVLAQQSIRELTLTNRTFGQVLAAAAFGVFEAGYKDGYGADGDHLKTKEEIKYALDNGYTMITLDCSEHIVKGVAELSEDELTSRYAALPAEMRAHYEEEYANKIAPVVGKISARALRAVTVEFSRAIDHAAECWEYMCGFGREVDFELSIDETAASTDPVAHYVIVNELLSRGVKLASVAPHFCGEFEKGIDYIGNLADFEREFVQHQELAEYFGSYKLSVHSGSDKFSIMPIVARVTHGTVHLKTAGTNWLEAVRALAKNDFDLYRRAHKFALAHQDEARKYYHITSSVADIPDIDGVPDAKLAEYLDKPASRQALHIAYGLLLCEPWFNNEFFAFLDKHENEYYTALERHIGKHLELLRGTEKE